MTSEELRLTAITDLQQRTKRLERAVGRLQRMETGGVDQLLSAFLALPGLRGFWPFTSMGDGGAGVDLSGQGRTLTNNNGVQFSHDGEIGHAAFASASSQYMSRADEAGLDILGNESYVASAIQGLTIGGWFWCNADNTDQGFIVKDNYVSPVSGQASYVLSRDTSNLARFSVSDSGAPSSAITGGDSPLITAGGWFFVVGSWRPNDPTYRYMVSVNGIHSYAGGATTGPLFNSNAPLEIGRYLFSATPYLNGRAALCFLCGAAVPDNHLKGLFGRSRGFFGV